MIPAVFCSYFHRKVTAGCKGTKPRFQWLGETPARAIDALVKRYLRPPAAMEPPPKPADPPARGCYALLIAVTAGLTGTVKRRTNR